MKIAAFIPIKAHSERIPGKNFRDLGGKPLFHHIVDNALKAGCFDDIYLDSNHPDVERFCEERTRDKLHFMPREPWYASTEANGNDLLVHHWQRAPGYALYFQLFATAPFLRPDTIADCVSVLLNSAEHDSVLTFVRECGFFWFEGQPVNYRPDLLPRSQDARFVVRESTGLYGVSEKSLDRYRCRVGARPFFREVSRREALDLDTEEDFRYAESLCGPSD